MFLRVILNLNYRKHYKLGFFNFHAWNYFITRKLHNRTQKEQYSIPYHHYERNNSQTIVFLNALKLFTTIKITDPILPRYVHGCTNDAVYPMGYECCFVVFSFIALTLRRVMVTFYGK